MYRPVGTSSSELFVFDAETCSPALDSYKELAITGLESDVIEDVMDLDPHATGQLTNLEDTSMDGGESGGRQVELVQPARLQRRDAEICCGDSLQRGRRVRAHSVDARVHVQGPRHFPIWC